MITGGGAPRPGSKIDGHSGARLSLDSVGGQSQGATSSPIAVPSMLQASEGDQIQRLMAIWVPDFLWIPGGPSRSAAPSPIVSEGGLNNDFNNLQFELSLETEAMNVQLNNH